MKMELTGQMRLEQRMKLAPRMIQSMEVLQLPLLALQEKIEAELNSNPVLEIAQEDPDEQATVEEEFQPVSDERELVVDADSGNAEDFQRLDSLDEDFHEFVNQSQPMRLRSSDEPDAKYEALQNTMERGLSLHEYLSDQWRLIEASDGVKEAGSLIIDYIDKKGYLTVHIDQLYNKDKSKFTVEELHQADELIKKLEPAGVGASDVRECLLIQLEQKSDALDIDKKIVSECYNLLLDNKLPDIAKKLDISYDEINQAIKRLSKLDTSPGLQVGITDNRPVTADVIVESREDGDGFVVRLTNTHMPNLQVNDFYIKMAKEKDVGEKTRQFLQQNIRSAQWLMDAIEQRKSTLLKVATAIVEHQAEFFEKGSLFLKPLPMQKIADEVGIHIATVSRAVAGKYVQCSQGVLPLRSFFSGGTETADGDTQSWDAIKALLQKIIDEEDKAKPLSDEKLCDKLKDAGVGQIARRTIAKYRKIMNIPSARMRKKF